MYSSVERVNFGCGTVRLLTVFEPSACKEGGRIEAYASPYRPPSTSDKLGKIARPRLR